jgi:hypothetical protein
MPVEIAFHPITPTTAKNIANSVMSNAIAESSIEMKSAYDSV